MENVQRVYFDQPRAVGDVPQPQPRVNQTALQPRRHPSVPEAPRASDQLRRQTELYHEAETLDSAAVLFDIAADRILRADRNVDAAQREGASLLALAMLEELQTTYGVGARQILSAHMTRPRRW